MESLEVSGRMAKRGGYWGQNVHGVVKTNRVSPVDRMLAVQQTENRVSPVHGQNLNETAKSVKDCKLLFLVFNPPSKSFNFLLFVFLMYSESCNIIIRMLFLLVCHICMYHLPVIDMPSFGARPANT